MSFVESNISRIRKLIDPIYLKFISKDSFTDVLEAETRHELAMNANAEQLLQTLIQMWKRDKSKDSKLTSALIEAAKRCQNELLQDLLMNKASNEQDLFFIFLDKNWETFLESMEITDEFLVRWEDKKYINKDQSKNLQAITEPTRAFHLISLLRLRREWYVDLLEVLTEVKQENYLDKCHPEFMKDRKKWEKRETKVAYVNEWLQVNKQAFTNQSSKVLVSTTTLKDDVQCSGDQSIKQSSCSQTREIVVEVDGPKSDSHELTPLSESSSSSYGNSETSDSRRSSFDSYYYQDYDSDQTQSSSILEGADLADLLGIDDPNTVSISSSQEQSSLSLYQYQLELAADAVEGENVLIVAPTNAGKTHVAMHIAQKHLFGGDQRRVLFIVHRVNLVDQQYKQFARYFDLKDVEKLSGGSSFQIPLSRVVKKRKIVVLTVDRVKNALALESEDRFFLSAVSLIIFDECHNCMKEHSYNIIMDYYHKELQSVKSSTRRPQIVGLTASPGTGKADNVDKAFTHLLQLCANLDCRIIASKSEKEIQEQWENRSQNIETKHVQAKTRTEKWLDKEIQSVMDKCEKALLRLKSENKFLPKCQAQVVKLLQIPSGRRGGQEYTNFVGNLKQIISCIGAKETIVRSTVGWLRTFLDILNRTLHVYLLFRDEDAVEYLISELPKEEDAADLNVVAQRLLKLIRANIIKDAQKHAEPNPCLLTLKEEILKQLETIPDSRVLVFVKERHFTKILVKVFSEDDDLKGIPVDAIIGAQNDSDSETKGATQRWQREVLTKFREGNKKVLFSTTVTEEGLDVVKCNVVIRYVHVTNEIAMVQSRGRARTEVGKYVVIYHERESWIGTKEDTNEERHKMMVAAVDRFRKYEKEEISRIVRSFIEMRNRERLVQRDNRETPQKSQIEYHFLCKGCDTFATSSKTIRRKKTHYICVDPDVRERCTLAQVSDVTKRMKDDAEIIGKLHCAKCKIQKWGVQCRYMNSAIVVLNIKYFNLLPRIPDEPCVLCDKWNKAPFDIKELDFTELFQN